MDPPKLVSSELALRDFPNFSFQLLHRQEVCERITVEYVDEEEEKYHSAG